MRAMEYTKGIAWLVLMPLFFSPTRTISDQCRLYNETRVECGCIGNEEFNLPEGYNYENITSLILSSCFSANLHFSSLTEANQIEEVVVQNIRELLLFELFLTSKKIKRFEILNVRRIPLITHDTFTSLTIIEHFEIRDTIIEDFKEQFTDIEVIDFVMKNVTIEHIEGLNFSEKGRNLRVVDCEFRNVSKSLNFAYFSNIEIANSKFALQKPGHVSIEGDVAVVTDNVFSNVSMNLVATNSIVVNSTCADGKSSLRLSSNKIESFGNSLPTEIVYTTNKMQGGQATFLNRNNTVCIAGNCKCPKSNGQDSHQRSSSFLIYFIVTLFLNLLID